MELPNMDDWTPEQVIAYCEAMQGLTPRQVALNRQRAEEDRKRKAEYCKEGYEEGRPGFYKKTCPVCGAVFYTDNPRRIYDDYYQCSRYTHRKNQKFRRELRRVTICEECGEAFTPKRKGAKYCSAACKQKAYRERRKAQSEHTQQP